MTEQNTSERSESQDAAIERIRVENARELERLYREVPWERLGIKNAPIVRRSVAIILDTLVIVGPAALLLGLVVFPAFLSLPHNGLFFSTLFKRPDAVWIVLSTIASIVLLLVALLVNYLLLSLRGTSAGRAIMGIRLIRTDRDDPQSPGLGRILLRALLIVAFSLFSPIGWIALAVSIAVDPLQRRRSWIDRTVKVWLTDRRIGLDAIDREALRDARRKAVAIDERREAVPSLSTAYGLSADRYLPGSRSRLALITEQIDDASDAPSLANMVRPPAGLSDALLAAQSASRRPLETRQPSHSDGPEDFDELDVPRPSPRDEKQSRSNGDTPAPRAATQPFTYAPPTRIETPAAGVTVPEKYDYQRTSLPRHEKNAEFSPDRVFTVQVDDLPPQTVTRAAVVGRKPDVATWAGESIILEDETRLISKSHALLERVKGRLVVQDLGSVNGTYLDRGGRWERLPEDHQSVIPTGARIGIGDRILTVSASERTPDIDESTTQAGHPE